MKDLERLLRDGLRQAGEGFRPRDLYDAERDFSQRRLKRRVALVAVYAICVAAAVPVGIVIAARLSGPSEKQSPAAPDRSVGSPSPADETEPTPDPEQRIPDLLFVYGQGGDLFGQADEGVLRLTKTPELESNPTMSPDRRTVIFERRERLGAEAEIVLLDLDQRSECCFFPGEHPAIGPDGLLTWAVPQRDGTTDLGSGRVASKAQYFFDADLPDFGMVTVHDMVWDRAGSRVFYETSYEGLGLYVVDAEPGPDSVKDLVNPRGVVAVGDEPGTNYLAPSTGPEIYVIKACCEVVDGEGLTTFELGELSGGAAGAPGTYEMTYQALVSLDSLGLEAADPAALFTAYADHLAVETDPGGRSLRWSVGESRSWFVGNGRRAWLVDEKGEATELPTPVTGGLAVP